MRALAPRPYTRPAVPAAHHILGQQRAVAALGRALASGQLHHAWILHGPQGVGKFRAATALARIALDPQATAASRAALDPPQGTPIARMIDTGTHPDLHVIRKELAAISESRELRDRKQMNIPLDLLRERMIGGIAGDGRHHESAVFRTAAMGHGKVFIVDEAELLDADAQNAMLKTLEEPAKGTVIILLSSRPGDLLPTILSRCQMVRFSSLPAELIEKELRVRDVPAEEARQAAELADGSLGQALLWSKEGVVGRAAEMGRKLRAALAGGERFAIGEEIKSAADAQGEIELKKDEKASKDQAVREAVVLYLDLAARQVRGVLAETADGIAKERLCDLIELIAEVADQVEANVNVVLALRRLELRLGSG